MKIFRALMIGALLMLFVFPALGEDAFTPSRRESCDHESCYWTTKMDITDEETVWKMLMAPVTVIKGNQKEQIFLLDAPGGNRIGEITCDSQSVHVLSEDQNGWTLIETYSSSFHDSKTKAYNALLQGYVKTELLETVDPADEIGLVVDKLTQRMYVFQDGKMITELRISTGLPNERQPYNETRTGEFFLVSRVGDFKSDNLVCEKGIRFNDGDLMHTVPYIQYSSGKDYSFCENVLGERASHGCIRVQRKRTPESINMTWLWNNYEKDTKLVIWEDWAGREYPEVAPETQVYYQPGKGKTYHKAENCYSVNQDLWPLTAISYGQLWDAEFESLTDCVWCNPPEKR